jgi:hypothetical protein
MKRILFILCLFFALSSVAAAMDFYDCVDKDGNKFITDNPPDGAKCTARDAGNESSSSKASSKPASPAQDGGATAQQKGEIDRLKKMPRKSYE